MAVRLMAIGSVTEQEADHANRCLEHLNRDVVEQSCSKE